LPFIVLAISGKKGFSWDEKTVGFIIPHITWSFSDGDDSKYTGPSLIGPGNLDPGNHADGG
jgi:hypothetical protein